MRTMRTVRVAIGEEDYAFLLSLAQELGLAPTDALAAFWKIGATAYAAQMLGYQLPPTLADWSPAALEPIWQQWLARQRTERRGPDRTPHHETD